MLANERQRQHRSILQTSKLKDIFKPSMSDTLSPMTPATTSSGYSTGSSSTSAIAISSFILRKQPVLNAHQQQQALKTKPKGFHHLFTKLKNLLLSPKIKSTKVMRPTTSRQISSTNILRQYHQAPSALYDVLPSSLATSKTVALPFTYYHDSPIRTSRTNFDQISAWLNHSEEMNHTNRFPSNDGQPQLWKSSSSSIDMDKREVTVVMKQISTTNIKAPKRSSSLVTKLTPTIVEQPKQQPLQRTNSPTPSFSSSILIKGMSDRLTSPSLNSEEPSSKSNRRRAIDFSRRKTVTGIHEQNPNKENLLQQQHQRNPVRDIYQSSSSTSSSSSSSNQPKENQTRATSKQPTMKNNYYFHSENNEDLLNNSYGLTLLQPQRQTTQKSNPSKHSSAALLMLSQLPKTMSTSQISSTSSASSQSLAAPPTRDSLDDLLCDREVESYFYPLTSSMHSDHIYINLNTPPDQYYPSSAAFYHGTLC